MASYEEELRNFMPVVKRLNHLALFGKKVVVSKEENFVKEGPNIIVGNHIGSFKDVAVLLKVVPRPIFFTANRMIFNKEEFNFLIHKHLRRHLKDFAFLVETMLKPLKYLFVRFVSTNIARVGSIPVDLYSGKRETIEICQDYLRKGRAIIALQGRGRVHPRATHPYVSSFRRGLSIMAYNLYQEGISVAVTPLAFYGTQRPFLIPGSIKVNVGEPMYIGDYLGGEFTESVERFRKAVELRVKKLFLELIRG